MLGVLLIILKIIGIALLVLLCLILALFLIVLFVPVRYKVSGYYRDKNYEAKAKITYLLHIISITVAFDKKLDLAIRIFGIRLKLKKKAKANNTHESAENVQNAKTDEAENSQSAYENSDIGEENSKIDTEKESTHLTEKNESRDDGLELSDSSNQTETLDVQAEVSDEKPVDQNDKKFSKQKKKNTRSESGLDKVKYYIGILKEEQTKLAFLQCKRRIGLMLKSILPRKGRIFVKLGMENAGTVGEILGIYSALYMYIGNVVKFVPVYTEKAFETEIDIKGHIRLVVLLHHLIMILLDRNCRRLIKIFLKKDRRQ